MTSPKHRGGPLGRNILIATPILIVNAFSPAVFALMVDRFGCSLVTWVAIELMSRWYEGAQSRGRSRMTA